MDESLSKYVNFQKERTEHDIESVREKCSSLSAKAREDGNQIFKNKTHNKAVHLEVIMSYSKSLAYAPLGSEDFALALNNRSILLLHLKKYDECIGDIDLALTVTESAVTKCRLLVRKIMCLKYMGKNSETKTIFDEASKLIKNLPDSETKNKLSEDLKKDFKPIKVQKKSKLYKKKVYKLENLNQLPYVSDAITLNIDEISGKHFVATRDIKSAEILLIEEAYCSYPDLKHLYITCSHCLAYTINSIPCNKCTYAVYCSIKCRDKAFEEYHDIECSIYPDFFAELIAKKTKLTHLMNLITIRLFIKLLKKLGVEEIVKIINIMENNNCFFEERSNIENFLKIDKSLEIFYELLSQKKRSTFNLIDETFFFTLLKNTEFFEKDRFFHGNIEELKYLLSLTFSSSMNKTFEVLHPNLQVTKDLFYDSDASTFRKVGTIINYACGIFNHSCLPNVGRIYLAGPKVLMYSKRPIKKNEKLFITFGPSIHEDKVVRTMDLKRYNYECNCEACTENWPAVDYSFRNKYTSDCYEGKNKQVNDFFKTINTFYNQPLENWGDNHDKNLKEIKKIIDSSYSSLKLFDATIISKFFQTQLHDLLFKMYGDDFEIPNEC